MDRSVLVCTVLVVLIITFSFGNGIIFHGVQELAVAQNNEHQMAPAVSYTPHGPITITSNADFFNQGWPGNGTSGNPYIIEELNITVNALCISIMDTTVYFEIRDCVISSGNISSYDEGISLDNVTHGTVQNCSIDISNIGIALWDCSRCTLTNNTAASNFFGYYLDNSDNCILTNNTAASNSQHGFHLPYSDNCTLTDNIAFSNNVGFRIPAADNCNLMNNNAYNNSAQGFYVLHTYNCTLTNNIACDNYRGIHLFNSNNCTVTYNTIPNNSLDNGIDSMYNTFYLNRIGGGGGDYGEFNVWDDGVSSGNYWKDYNGIGNYSIPGTAGSVDNYPFVWEDIVIPIMDSPSDVEYAEGESGNSITWSPSDEHPRNYTIYRDDVTIASGIWDGSQITIEVDGLSQGVYNYTLVVNDAIGNIATDTVFVTVLEATTTSTTTTTTSSNLTTTTSEISGTMLLLVLSSAGIAGVVIVVVIILRKRRG